jgi:hypothetical protein
MSNETTKTYPTEEAIAKCMEDCKLNRIGAVHFLRRQAAQPAAKPVVDRKATREAHAGKKPAVKKSKAAYGDYTPSAQKQAAIDEKIRAAIGKGVAVEAMIGVRNSYSEKGGQPFQRYYLSNGHTCFVSGFVTGETKVTVSEHKADPKSYTIKAYLARRDRAAKRAAKKAAKPDSK